jgi:glycine hydroxymethyltransferase
MFGESSPAPSTVDAIIAAERRRQYDSLILIPSESICHPSCSEVLASCFSNVYAEGQPSPPLMHDPRESAVDESRFASWHRRLADARFYRGCRQADRVELFAQQQIAEAYARLDGSPDVRDIHVCVQALSGAPANTAVYEALLEHGDTILGLDLSHGGHLTHGSEFNYSGKTYNVISYGIDETTRRLDYARIADLAREHRPKLIIGGASSYAWDFDWAELRRIADEVGAFLLADVAHLAGMIVAGLLNNPVPHAHVVTHTTHKTLCGPRGAAILTTYAEIAKRLAAGVFPGLQGGPHLHTIAAIGRLFELINQDRSAFVDLQQAILDNTAYLADRLVAEGFTLEYGGTNTHLLLVDLKQFEAHPNAETPVDGEIASRLLEQAGIVCNKNVLPGDETGGKASGIRLGMPWLTQRRINREHISELASIIRDVLGQIHTFRVWVPAGEERCRAKVPDGVLARAAERVRGIAAALPYPPEPNRPPLDGPLTPPEPPDLPGRTAWLLRGDKVSLALDQMLTCPVASVRVGDAASGFLLDDAATELAEVCVVALQPVGREERFALLVPADASGERAVGRIRSLSDGYLLFDENDLYAKIDGPTVVEPLPPADLAALLDQLPEPAVDLTKPFFIGQRALYEKSPPTPKRPYERAEPELPVRKTVLNETHRSLGAKMVAFAGWDMPVQYPAGILAEHAAVRTGAGLFDVSHMSLFDVRGRGALAFLDVVLANCVSRLHPGEAQYTYLLRPDGTAIDDLYVYRLERDRFMIVANAANGERDWDWLNAVNSREILIDTAMPGKQIEVPVALRNLRDDGRLGLALQGPASAKLLCKLAESGGDRFRIERLLQNQFTPAMVAGIDTLVARTGYTGESVGFELYSHPSRCIDLWNALLEAGGPIGVRPAGLGARDSTRTEAGFPLFGHELEGPCGLSLTEAGYGFVTRFHVPFFIGRAAYIDRVRNARRRVLRLRGQGRRSIRPGHAIVDSDGNAIGQVTSAAFVQPDFTFFALAAVDRSVDAEQGDTIRAVRQSTDSYEPPPKDNAIVELEVLPRFPDDDEREGWPMVYA